METSEAHVNERRIRYHATKCGFPLMQTRGDEYERRRRCGIGAYLLIDRDTNAVVLPAATLAEITEFLDSAPRQQLHQERLH